MENSIWTYDNVSVWLAALIDGEGCITVHKGSRKTNNGPQLLIELSIGNTCKDLVDAVLFHTGVGYITQYTYKGKNWKTRYMWRVGATGCRTLIPRVLPWLVAKREQALLAVQFMESSDQYDFTLHGNEAKRGMNTDKVKIAEAISLLNEKGRY